MAEADRVELAHEPDFTLGRLTVSPSRRALIRTDGTQDVLEHRVMQVLIALARAKSGIVTRDELTQSCWDNRVVGEDAINRVISRLRRAAETIGADSFRIETVTKIGYRLIVLDADGEPVPLRAPAASSSRVSRRALVAGAVAVGGIALAGGGTLLYRKFAEPGISPEVVALLQQGHVALAQSNREGTSQAVGLYRRATEISPDYADGWGLLGLAYARFAYFRPKGEYEAMRERARAVAARALQLDPDNCYAFLAQAMALPHMGHWIEGERLMRGALAVRPGEELVLWIYATFLNDVGRFTDAIALFDQIRTTPRPPSLYYQNILSLWGAGRLDRLDRMTSEAAALYPSQFALWFVRLHILLFSRQLSAAIAFAEDVENRPSGIDADQFDSILAVARAARSGNASEIDALMKGQMQSAHLGSGLAENAMQFACLFGRLDEAFAIADAYFFDRGFSVPELRFSNTQGSYAPKDSRYTRVLFGMPTKPMRTDTRFDRLTEELGLNSYWREVGAQPDYRRH